MAARFFVVSSFRNGMIWYDRCNFAGRYVTCVLMNYPAAEKTRWDAIVSRISNSLFPRAECRSGLGRSTAPARLGDQPAATTGSELSKHADPPIKAPIGATVKGPFGNCDAPLPIASSANTLDRTKKWDLITRSGTHRTDSLA